MVEESVALAQILQATRILPPVLRPLAEARGFFLAESLRARSPHPRFSNSSVDGYAVRAEDGMATRRIIGEQPAGRDAGWRLGPDEAVRIFTGAPLPTGCTAVVMQEDVVVEGQTLLLTEAAMAGENIRRLGGDVAEGQILAAPGSQITPQLIGLLASQGFTEFPVHRAPEVTILSTGDELRAPGEPLANGEIYESNAAMLIALLAEMGIPAKSRCLADERSLLATEMAAALETSDVLLLSGGVSVGDHDYVRPALAELGIFPDLWQIRMKPGKPLAFARSGERLIFGLPGNPVSAFVTFLMLVRPALRKMLGAPAKELSLPCQMVEITDALENRGDRPHYLRGKIHRGRFVASSLQQSHALLGLSQSNALLRLEAGENVPAGAGRGVFTW